MDATESASETAGGFRGSEAEGNVSMDLATGGGGPLETTLPSAIYGENAPMVRPHPGVAWGQRPKMKLELIGDADRPPRSASPLADFPAVCRRLRDIRDHYTRLSRTDIANDFDLAVKRVHRTTVRQFEILGRPVDDLPWRTPGMALAEQAYPVLQEAARQADNDRDLAVLVIFVRLWETSATLPPASGTS